MFCKRPKLGFSQLLSPENIWVTLSLQSCPKLGQYILPPVLASGDRDSSEADLCQNRQDSQMSGRASDQRDKLFSTRNRFRVEDRDQMLIHCSLTFLTGVDNYSRTRLHHHQPPVDLFLSFLGDWDQVHRIHRFCFLTICLIRLPTPLFLRCLTRRDILN